MTRVLYLIACAAGPARHVDTGIRQAQQEGWDVCLILTPSAARWHEQRLPELEKLTERPVRSLREQGVRVVFGPGEPHPPKQGDARGFSWRPALDAARA